MGRTRSEKITPEEEQWLRIRAEENKSFESLLNSYEKKGYLSDFQRNRLRNEIAKEMYSGDIELEEEELIFLKKYSNIDSKLEEMLEKYETYECFTEYEYRKFIELSLKCSRRKNKKKNLSVIKKRIKKTHKNPKEKVIPFI